MRIYPQRVLQDRLLINNVCIIVCIFCLLCFFTALSQQNAKTKEYQYGTLPKEGILLGPIEVDKKSQIFKVNAHFSGSNTSTYISGEVLDKDKDTLYEFGKDLWHEEGYDSEGHWSEAERNLSAYLTFSEKGTYYIKMMAEEGAAGNISVSISRQKSSYVAHLEVGSIFFMLMLFCMAVCKQKMG